MDYWGWNSRNDEVTRNVININSDAIRFDIYIPMIDRCYAYLVETGQILFAGKNSIYYGHCNISELN